LKGVKMLMTIFLVLAVGLLIAAVWSSDRENTKRCKELEQTVMRYGHSLTTAERNLEKLTTALGKDVETFLATHKALRGEVEVLTVRQRTLEKSIIKSERTINLNIIPPTGKGRASLLKTAGLT
jgi:hypothetical protein